MRSIPAFLLAVLLTFTVVINVAAQSTESIWLTLNTTTYKTRETVIATLNASSATPVQGFTFQIRYDPKCLKPINAVSQVPGMNALPLPQISGLADGSYASTTPQTVNGVLAEVRFEALGGCKTGVKLESAALAIRNESGFAAPVKNVTVAKESIALNIDKAVGEASTESLNGSVLPLEPPPAVNQGIPSWAIVLLSILLLVGLMFGAFKLFKVGLLPGSKSQPSPQTPILQIKHGPQSGKSFALDKLPCYIGRDPDNEICLNDPHIISQHAKIYAADNRFFLMDLGGETFVNGRAIRQSAASLKPGDVVRLGKSALFVFGSQPS
jgi:Inner membrane component of T3SS, cytoplasmic domain/Cohesin domain